jgi:hypothetical protein
MRDALALLNKYAETFRDMISRRVWSSDKSIRQLLKLNAESDWDFLTAAMDIVGDASSAIEHVRRFGLSGPTKYDDTGEMYLRLYGLLSATYAQQESILTVYKVMQVTHPRECRKRFDALQIRMLRHKLTAHSTGYDNREAGTVEAFVPVQIQMGDRSITYANYTASMNTETVDLAAAVEAHAVLMVATMDQIFDKSIGTLFASDVAKGAEFESKLADLRVEKAGGLVFGSSDSSTKIVITFVGPKDLG